jgi:ADP-L-glycero-D-manno-heptose 6-epimerase
MMDNITYEYLKKDLDISIVGLKYFNVYGPREFYKNKTASMVVQFGHQILKGLTPKLFEGSDKIVRDFIYIEDIIQANIKACKPKKSGIYNVGTGKARSFEDIVNILQKELKIDNGKEYITNPYIGQYQFFTQANIQTTKENLNYEPKYSMEDGIIAYIPEIKRLFEQEMK